MGLVDRISARAEARRADPVTLEEFGALLARNGFSGGRTRAGVTMTPTRALELSAWYSGVRYLSETLASLPVFTYRKAPLSQDRDRRADPPWLSAPDIETPWFTLCEHWMMSLLHRGNAYANKLRDPVGRVVGLRPVHPDRVKVGRASDGTKVFQVDNADHGTVALTSREILHIPDLSYDGVAGLDPIRVHAQSLGLQAAQDEYAQRYFGQGNHTHGYISMPGRLTEDEADDVKRQWTRFHKGLANAHDFGVLGDGATYETIGLDPEQVQLLESRKFGVTEIARMLRLPPHKLYDLERSTFSNIEHQSIEAVVDGIRPRAVRLEAHINFDPQLLPSRNFVEFQLEGLLRGDAKARADYYHAGITDGWLNRNEPRRKENLPAVDGLDAFLVPQNMAVQNPDGSVAPVNEGA